MSDQIFMSWIFIIFQKIKLLLKFLSTNFKLWKTVENFNNKFFLFHLLTDLTVFLLTYLINSIHAVVKSSSNEINSYLNRFHYDYCESGLCASNKRHVACGNKGRFGRSCTSDARVIEFDDYHKRLILHLHNVYRNQIASGQTPGFSQASRMGVLQWDDELAYLAELNAMSCEIEVRK